MKMIMGGLTAECDCVEAPRVSERMLCILHDIRDRRHAPSNVVIHYKPDNVYYEVIDGIEVKHSALLKPIQQ